MVRDVPTLALANVEELWRAAGVVDICLIPEVHFAEDKLMQHIDRILNKKGHIVICVAEGAGQDMLLQSGAHQGFDASGNPILQDVGTYLRHAIRKNVEVALLTPSHPWVSPAQTMLFLR